MNTFLPRVSAAVALACAVAIPCYAQSVGSQSVRGVINDSLGRPIADAHVSLMAADGRAVGSTQSDPQGHFTIAHVVPGVYQLTADKTAFQPSSAIITVTGGAGATRTLTLASNQALEIQVKAQRLDRARNGISVETGSSSYRIDQKAIAALPQGESTPLNQVILQAPGVAQDSFGQVHVRGDHNDLQYRINGIILPESISGFGQTLDTRFAQSVNLLTGALPAEYGYRTAGIIDIQTKSGAFANGGEIGVMGGSHNTGELHGNVSGSQGNFNYYVTGSLLQNDLGIENPTASNSALHNHTTQGKGFGYFSYLLNDTSRVSLILGSADSRFQIPNSPDQTINYTLSSCDPNCQAAYPSSTINDNQHETNRYGILALQGTLGDKIDYQVSGFSRYSKVEFGPDNNADLLYQGVASQVLRTSFANGLQADGSYKLDAAHTLRTGLFFSQEQLDNHNSLVAFQADNSGNQLLPPQLTAFTDNNSKTAYLYGVYAQDEWKPLDRLTINYGARFDKVDAYTTGSQLSPRLGSVYQLDSDTTLHVGYARYFTPPPTELVTTTTVANSQGTTAAPPGTLNDPVKPESADYYDVGISHAFDPHLTMGLDSYYKNVTNLLDEGQFGSALLFTPFNYRYGKIYGLELTANYHKDNLSAYVNVAHSTALGKDIVSAQYNFDPADLSYIANNWIHLDHDQLITASAGASYLMDGTTYSADALFGSGLRKDSGVPNGGVLTPYTQVNLAAAHTFNVAQLGKVQGRLSVNNVFDRVYEIRDGTGVGVGAPQFGPRRAFFVSIDKYF